MNEITRSQLRDGAWHEASGDGVIELRNPADGTVLARYRAAGREDVEHALEGLHRSARVWARAPLSTRQALLGRIAEEIRVDRDRIARQMTLEMGKPLNESLVEVDTFIGTCRWYQHEAGRAIGEVLPSADGRRTIHTRRKPVGVVLCITPWNFPIALAGYKIFAALAVGNVVVWKPAEQVNGTALLVGEAFRRAGVGAEFALLASATGSLASVGVEDGRVDAVSFTGSTAVGVRIAEQMAPRLAPCSLELGGKNAAVVLADADLTLAADEIVRSAFLTSGQRCTATSRIIAVDEVADELADLVIERMARLRVGGGFTEGVTVGPLATHAQREKVEGAVAAAVAGGARVRAGGQRPADLPDAGAFYAPTLLDRVTPTMPIAREEIFGPVVALLRAGGPQEAFEIADDSDYGLSTAVFTRNLAAAHAAADSLSSGLVYINRGTSAAELGVPFGGTGMSGNGHREVSAHGFEFMTELVSVYVDPGELT